MANDDQIEQGVEAPEGEASKKSVKRKRLIKFAAIGMAVVSISIVAGYLLMGGQVKELTAKDPTATPTGTEPQAESTPSEGEAPVAAVPEVQTKKVDGVEFGCSYPMKPFNLNLGNPLENRYIRLEVSVEYGCSEEQKEELTKRLPQLRDAIISVTGRKTREFLLGPDGKAQLRKEIHGRVNHYMNQKVDDVFITDILIE